MRKDNNIHFILDSSTQNDSMGEKLGKLSLEYQSTENAAPFELLDCFDQSIRKSGQALIFSKNKLILLQKDAAISNQTVDEASVFINDLKDGPVKSALGFISPLRRILPVARGTLSTQLIKAVDDERKIHVRVYLQTFQVKGVDTQVTLATLQGIRGYNKAFGLMKQKVEQPGCNAVQDISSLYGLLISEYQPYNPKPDIIISKDERAFQAANDIIKAYIEIARLNEPGILADKDTEFLHDYRVSLRKVRSVLSLFKGIYSDEQTQMLKQAFADLMSPTGRLRDLDVYLLDRQHYFELLPVSLYDGLAIMFDIFAVERDDQLKKISVHLKSSAYKNKISSLEKLFSEPDALPAGANADYSAYLYASMLIWKRYRKVCKIARAITPATDDAEVHDLRIQCKKLRYLMEFFSPMYPAKKIKGLIKALKLLQDNLGLFNDYSVQQDSLHTFILTHASKGRKRDLIVAKSAGALIAMLYQKQIEERSRVISNFEIFDSRTTQQQFRKLFKND